MPFFRIETSKDLKKTEVNDLTQKASQYVAKLLNKPEKWVMVSVVQPVSMMFQGSGLPCAFLTLKSIELDLDNAADLSAGLCAFIEKETGIASDRVYIDFISLDRKSFGWNSTVF